MHGGGGGGGSPVRARGRGDERLDRRQGPTHLTLPEVIQVDATNRDAAGCLVGPSGEKVCPLVAIGADGRSQVAVSIGYRARNGT